jgi:tetratricopeptide (TPR) repeat protein
MFSRNKLIVAGAALAALVVLVAWWASSGSPGSQEKESARQALDLIYEEALDDQKSGRLLDSISKLNQLKNINPSLEKAEKQLAAATDEAIAEAQEKIARGREEEAREALDRLLLIDPDNKEAQKIRRKLPDKAAPEPGAQPPAQPVSDPTPTAGGKLDDPNTKPIDVVPDLIDGYELKNKWDDSGLAGAAYSPTGAAMSNEVEAVLLTIGKGSASGAQERLAREKSLFPNDATKVEVNGYSGYSGRYGGLVTLAWTQDKWFFAIHAVPNQAKSFDFLRGTALDVSSKLGI